jgi:hypothetical protein
MANDRTCERLQEAADLLQMLEEMMASGLIGRTSAAAGAKVTLRNAREAVVRTVIELKHEKTSDSAAPIKAGNTTLGAPSAEFSTEPGHSPAVADESVERLMTKRRELRASIEKVVERTPSAYFPKSFENNPAKEPGAS